MKDVDNPLTVYGLSGPTSKSSAHAALVTSDHGAIWASTACIFGSLLACQASSQLLHADHPGMRVCSFTLRLCLRVLCCCAACCVLAPLLDAAPAGAWA
jgi:hypothetical protein